MTSILSSIHDRSRQAVERTLAESRQEILDRELRDACMEGAYGQVKALIERGARPDSGDGNGWTPLMWAVVSKKTVDMAHGRGAGYEEGQTQDIRRRTNMSKMLETVNLLLEKGASRNLRNADGETALDIARREGCTEAVKLLGHASSSN